MTAIVRNVGLGLVALTAAALLGYVLVVPVGQALESMWLASAVLAWCISLSYARSGWWRNPFGRAFMLRNTAIAALLTWACALSLDLIDGDWSRRVLAALAALVAVAFLNFLLTLTRRQFEERHQWVDSEGQADGADR